MSGLDHPERCAECTTGPTCWINATCAKQRDSAKVEAPTPAADAQDSSYRAEIESLTSKLAVQSKLTRDAEQQRDQYQAAMLRQNEVNNELYLRHQAEIERLCAEAAKPFKLEENEQYQLQMAGICTAAIGYWVEGDSIHPDYDTPALHDVAIRYAAYAKYHAETQRLQGELNDANDSLIAARSQIAALVADQRETDADRQRELREYVTTRQFHQQQASMAPSRGVSIPAAELEVTEQEDEAFKVIPPSRAQLNEFIDKVCLGDSRLIACAESAFYAFSQAPVARSSAEIRLDDIEQRMERAENAYLVLQGRVNTAFDRLDGLKGI